MKPGHIKILQTLGLRFLATNFFAETEELKGVALQCN